MESLAGYIVTGIISLAVGLILQSLKSRPKIVFWQPHYALFDISEPKISLQTDSLSIQNLGRKEAENVEIIFKKRPDFFKLTPPLQFTEETTPNNEFIIKIPSLGAKEYLTLHILSYTTPPRVESIRSKAGIGTLIPFQMQRKFPRWFELVLVLLMLIGMGVTLYWLIMVIMFISDNIGAT